MFLLLYSLQEFKIGIIHSSNLGKSAYKTAWPWCGKNFLCGKNFNY